MLPCIVEVERSFLKLVAHGSPRVLEEELLDRVAAAKSPDPLAPVLIVVPSRRLADHVAHRLIERFGGVLGVSVLHYRALAERILESAGRFPPAVLDDDLFDTLLARVIQRAPAGALRDFVRDRPGAAAALGKSLTDLREAGIGPSDCQATLTGTDAEIAGLFARWTQELDELLARGIAIDEAGMTRAAAAKAPEFAARFTTILHHGAYDLIGLRVDLLRALDRGRSVTFLLPADPGDRSGLFGVERARTIAGAGVSVVAVDRDAAPASVEFFHAQGAQAELQTAVYEALAAIAAGLPPHEVAIVVRSFGPYLAALDRLIDTRGPHWHTSYTRPLRRDPAAAKALREIFTGEDRGPCRWRDHADAFDAIARASPGGEILAPLFLSMRGIELILGDDRKVARAEALGWLEARADGSMRPPDGADGGGPRILDAMQARGLTFSHIGLLGMNSGIFPHVGRENPFLKDASRRLLREATGRPIPIASERDGEERLLLAMLLGQAQGSIHVSWRRADEAARPLVPSLALHEIAPDALVRARAIPAHPRSRYEAWARSPGVLGPRDESLLAGLSSELGADAAPAIAARRPELSPGLFLIAETETFAPTTGRYDGRIGRSALRETIDATALERLGRCPLQFFFRDVLRIEAPRKPPTPFTDDSRTVGERIHETLRRVYERLLHERAFESGDVDARVERARAVLREAWAESLAAYPSLRTMRLPVLERIEGGIWLRTLDAFLDADLRRMAADGLVPASLEHRIEKTIPDGPPGLVVRARFDRVTGGAGATVIGDYKTGGDLGARMSRSAMLSGGELQVPLYALIADAPVELLGVGPRHDGEVARFDGWKSPDERDGVVETLRIAAALAGAGRFPLHSGDHCRVCDYRSACRRGHPPTEYREEISPDVRDARDCWHKTGKAPSIAAVRREAPS
jgi:RecB family exonuclease